MLDVCSRFYLFVESIILRLRERCALRVRVQVCALIALSAFASACSPTLIGNVKLSKGITSATSSSTVGAVALTLTGPASVTAGVCSTAFVVTTVDATPLPIAVTSNTTITMSGLGAGSLYSDLGCTTGLSPVVIASGTSSKTFYFKSTVAASHTIGVSSGTLVTASSGLTVNAAGAVVANSTIAGVPNTGIAADGVSTSTITVTLRDSYNNVVPGATVTFASTGTGNTLVQPGAVTDASGVATGTLASTVAEAKTISISAPAGLGAVTNTVTFIASSVSVANSTISSTTPVVADGSATSTVTITLLDGSSNPVSGVTPTLTVGGTGNTVNACSASDGSGVSTCTISSTKAETKTVAIATPISKAGNNVVFTHGTASKLVYTTQPAGAVSGIAFATQPVIEIRDANDNVVTTGADATRVVTMSKQTGTGTLSGTLTLAAVAGVADFTANALTIDIQGSKTLRASATLNAVGKTVDSSAFVVDPIACDAGTLSTTCTISTTHTIPTGVDIAGTGNLVVANGGRIENPNPKQDITISMTGNVTVQNGGSIYANVWPLTAANVTIDTGGYIAADDLGYRGANTLTAWVGPDGEGPSPGIFNGGKAGGGAHCGAGGRDPVNASATGGAAYDSPTNPSDYGSGGAAINTGNYWAGGNGGGRIKLVVSGTLTNNGQINADGGSANSGSGGGGTLHLTAGTIAGVGVLRARGGTAGDGANGGGGGGCIYVSSAKLPGGQVYFDGGGTSAAVGYGADGTYRASLPSNDAICDSGTWATTCVLSSDRNLAQNYLTLTGANFTIDAGGVLRIASNDLLTNRTQWLDLQLTGDFTMQGWAASIVGHISRLAVTGTATLGGGAQASSIVGNVGGPNSGTHPGLTAAQVQLLSASTISASAQGYEGANSAARWFTTTGNQHNRSSVGLGTGGGNNGNDGAGCVAGSGGGYGGAGGAGATGSTGGVAYGSASAPADYGSGGGAGDNSDAAGNGGGVIRISATTSLSGNAAITSDGGWGRGWAGSRAGGGAGGMVRIDSANGFGSYTGSITANGGDGGTNGSACSSGGGGGGRILLTRTSGTAFAGTATASGGSGATNGAAGTVVHAPGSADASTSTIASGGSVTADGVTTSTITITLLDAYGFAVYGVTPTFTATDTGTTNAYGACSATNASGVSTCTLSSAVHETKTLSISSPAGLTGVTGSAVFTAYCPATLTPNIAAAYPTNGANWNDYVDVPGTLNSTTNTSIDQADTACAGTGNGYFKCIHGAEIKKLTLTNQKTCTQITSADTLGAFEWSCKVVSGTAVVYSKGLKAGKGLKDLINGTGNGFASNRLTVTKSGCGSPYLQTPAQTNWWGNTVTPVTLTTAAAQTLSSAGTIYTVTASGNTTRILLDADKAAFVTLPGVTMTYVVGVAPHHFFAQSGTRKYMWYEVNLDGNNVGQRCALLTDTSYSRFHQFNCTRFTNAGLYGATTFKSNLISDSNFSLGTNTGNGSLEIAQATYTTVYNTRISNTGAGINFGQGTQNAVVRTRIENNTNSGFNLSVGGTNNGSGNILTQFVSSNFPVTVASYAGASGSNNNQTITHGSVLNSSGVGISADVTNGASISGVVFSNILIANSAQNGVYINGATSTKLYDIMTTNTGANGILVNNATTVTTRGRLLVGNNTTADCALTGTNSGVELDASCHYGSGLASNATTAQTISGVLLGKVSTDDTSNASDTNGAKTYASISDWISFETFFRGWGIDSGNAYPDSAFRSTCTTGITCRIFDARISTGDATLKNIHGVWAAGAACPASVDASSSANVITDGMGRVFLKNAVEVMMDRVGNENGLCETGEDCIYAPNIGAYQGEGTIDTTQTCTFTGGNGVTGVTLYAYPTNGQ